MLYSIFACKILCIATNYLLIQIINSYILLFHYYISHYIKLYHCIKTIVIVISINAAVHQNS